MSLEESALVSALKEVYEDCTGQKAQCMSTAGATYARAFRESVAFGPLPVGKEKWQAWAKRVFWR